MSENVTWSYNGPPTSARRVTTNPPGHSVTVQATYAPTHCARHAIAVACNSESAVARRSLQEPDPADQRLHRLLVEWLTIAGRMQTHYHDVNRIDAKQRAVAADGKPNTAKRLARLSCARKREFAAQQLAQAELDERDPILDIAKCDAQREQAEHAKLLKAMMPIVLEKARRDLEQEILDVLSPLLTRLVAIDTALDEVRSRPPLSRGEQEPESNIQPTTTVDQDAGGDAWQEAEHAPEKTGRAAAEADDCGGRSSSMPAATGVCP